MPRALVAVTALCIVAAAAYLTVRSQRPGTPAPVAAIKVVASFEGAPAVTLVDDKIALPAAPGEGPFLSRNVDISKWRGELVRIDIESTIQSGVQTESSGDLVACRAVVMSGAAKAPLIFAGWLNDGSRPYLRRTLGCPARAVKTASGEKSVFGHEGGLWSIFRVPPKEAALQLEFHVLAPERWAKESRPTQAAKRPGAGLSLPAIANPGERPPDIFIYLIDALRADHLGCYGYGRPTSPQIDAFAEEATLFESAHAPITWTLPSVASIFSGLYPTTHGVVNPDEDKVGEWTLLLPEALGQRGYRTAAVISNSYIGEVYGFDRGIDQYVRRAKASCEWINRQAQSVLEATDSKRPLFVYLHALEPHAPYEPRPETLKIFDRGYAGAVDGSIANLNKLGAVNPQASAADIAHLIDLYDAEIRDNDAGFGDFLRLLKEAGRYEDSLIILVADHGEAFNEHRTLEHGRTLNQEEMRVPLIIRFPGGRFAGRRIAARVSLIDLFPTIVAQAGIRPNLEYSLPGWDLGALVGDEASGASRRIFAELPTSLGDRRIELLAVIDEDGYKRVLQMLRVEEPGISPASSIGLWDAARDPQEKRDIADLRPLRAAYGEQLAAHWLLSTARENELRPGAAQPAPQLTEELREELRALGYLD